MSRSRRPNIILIMTDQQRADTIAAHGFDYMTTPAMDRIANRGVSFRRAFACGATCIVSRAALFTGMYAQNTGAFSFYPWAHHRTWVHDLRDAGYHCVNIGKMHLDPKFDQSAFHERVVVENPSRPTTQWSEVDDAWGRFLSRHGRDRIGFRHESDPTWRQRFQAVSWHMEDAFHPDVFVGDEALGWIHRHVPREPVFLQIGFTGPHEPYDPLERHLRLYDDVAVPKPTRGRDELTTKPPQQQAHLDFNDRFHHECQIAMPEAEEADIERMRRHYYAKVTTVDEKVGEILDSLEKAGYLEDAFVIFTSDHGDMLGDHNLPYKWFMYDDVVNVPLIIWDTTSEASQGYAGTSVSELVSQIDLGPTILDVAGVDAPRYLEGRSLLGYFSENTADSVPYVVAQDNYMTMIRTDRWKLIWYSFQEDVGELYNLEDDPAEIHNLYGDPECEKVRHELAEALLRWSMRSGYRTGGYKNTDGQTPLFWPQESAYLHHAAIKDPTGWDRTS